MCPPSQLRLRPEVLAARERLAAGREKLRAQHESGSPGIQVSTLLTDLLDQILQDLFGSVVEAVGQSALVDEVALVAHGGYGRREMAPYSDVDLMLLYASAAAERVAPLARQLTHHVYDAGMQMGFSVRTPAQARSLAMKDATVFTSLAESRCLAGSEDLFSRFMHRFRRAAKRRARSLIAAISTARRQESHQYGETVYLLQPNVKRSQGGLRDLQMIRWIGLARYGDADPEHLMRSGLLPKDDFHKLRRTRDLLLRLRNELHFHARKSQDVLIRDEQLRLAELYGYQGQEGLLPVEQFMRDYFEHTSDVHYALANFMATAQAQQGISSVLFPLVSHQVEGDFRVGPRHISATRRGLEKLRGDLSQVLRLMDLANLYNKRIDHATWVAIRQDMAQQGEDEQLSPQAVQRFLSLISQPAQLGELLRRLHQLRVLERIIPGMQHARCLVQFNEYHKYTVDEHSIRAVECATEFLNDSGTLGEVYRGIKQKRTLHLALLIHDLGKGYPEDHSEVGRHLAEQTALRLQLPPREAEVLKFLVHKHLYMSRLALWRDIADQSLVVQFAVEVGSLDVLQMLFVLTCADLAAVGPGVLNQWKLTLLTELYHKALEHLAGERLARRDDQTVAARRQQLRQRVGSAAKPTWWEAQIRQLPHSFIGSESPERLAELLEQLESLPRNEALAWARYLPQQSAVEYTVGTYEQITPGVFHKLTGALSSQGLQILSAEIHTLADMLVLDRFYVHDLDYAGQPPANRLQAVCSALVDALKQSKTPSFRRIWNSGQGAAQLKRLPTRVLVDNNSSERYTILDIFAHDRIGLLYTVARTLFELQLSVHVAKIGTYLDQAVDVFYVTDHQGRKVQDEQQLAEISARLLSAIEASQDVGQ